MTPAEHTRRPIWSLTTNTVAQKVRNLRSHNTLDGLADYTKIGNAGSWSISLQGRTLLQNNLDLIDYLLSSKFDYTDAKEIFAKLDPGRDHSRKLIIFDDRTTVIEGKNTNTQQQTRTRSKRLRDIAIDQFSNKGQERVCCSACGFDFEGFYGELGQGYIEIHHLKPIVAYEDEDIEQTIRDALNNVAPLCSNCHRMVHRHGRHVMPVDELRKLIEQRRNIA